MLGLSFMGQPFQSLGCLNEGTLVDGWFKTARRFRDSPGGENVSLAEIRRDGGQCLGVDSPAIRNYFSSPLPRQNVFHCSTDHSLFVFQEDDVKASVCFSYLFNLKKNIRQGSKLPCGYTWDELDVVISIFPNKLIKETYLPKLRAPPSISTTFLSVLDVYQSTLEPQLRKAHADRGWPAQSHKDLLAFPQDCDKRDVHYALPGFTDHAVSVWMAMLASGLLPPPETSPRRSGGVTNAGGAGPHFVGRWV